MPSHSQQLRLELGRPLFLLPSSGFHSPGAWCPHLCTRQASFSAHERDLERRGIHGACLVGAPPALLLGGNSSRAVRVSPGLQEAQPPCNKRYMWQTRKEKKRDDTSSHSSSLPQRADPLVVQTHRWPLFCPGAEETSVGQRASLHPAPNSLLPADLGLLHGAQVGVIDEGLLPAPAPGQGVVLLQDRGVLLLGSRVIL